MPSLYPFQEEGAQYLAARRRAYLADAPGLGKTPQSVIAALRAGVERPLVICPAIAREMWHRTWQHWAGQQLAAGVTVLSYDRLIRSAVLPPHDLLVLDEAHYVKSTGAKRTRAALQLANRAERVWLLSGTPMPNHVGDLYAPLRAVWPDLLRGVGVRTEMQFLARYAVTRPTPYGFQVVGQKNVAELREILDQVMLRRTLDDAGFQLPPLRWETHHLPADGLTALQVQELEELEADLAPLSWDDALPADTHTSTARRLMGELKAEPVGLQLAQELTDDPQARLVVLAYHRGVLGTLERLLSRFGLVYVDGETSEAKRQRAIDMFEARAARVFLGQLTAVGTAISLTSSHEVVLVEQLWNPEENLQAVKRIHRIGQEHPCRARMFFAPSSIDDAVASVLARKMRLLGEIFHS